jgi:hypothetical protein
VGALEVKGICLSMQTYRVLQCDMQGAVADSSRMLDNGIGTFLQVQKRETVNRVKENAGSAAKSNNCPVFPVALSLFRRLYQKFWP